MCCCRKDADLRASVARTGVLQRRLPGNKYQFTPRSTGCRIAADAAPLKLILLYATMQRDGGPVVTRAEDYE